MTSRVELTEILSDRRERSGSAGSIMSVSSEKAVEPINYGTMCLEELINIADNLDISAFDRTRLFNPRKQRSCHKRSEPVSEEHRKMESSKNSREYTKRNRDEIATCRLLLNNIHALRCRFREVITELSGNNVQNNVCAAVADFERIFSKCFNFNSDMKQKLNIPSPEVYLVDYRKNADDAMLFEHRPSSPNMHKEKLLELREQFEKLTGDKVQLNSSKDKTNYASSKSRLNQRIVREQLKSNCWECWNHINTMIIQGEKLQQHFKKLKKEIWINILGIYYNLLGLARQRPIGLEHEQIEKIKKFFAPFSLKKNELLVKLVPPEVEIIEPDEQTFVPTQKSCSPQSQVTDTKSDRLSPISRPKSMDMTQLLRPQFMEKLMIQDRLVPTTQFTPSALPSPSFTLTLPTVPADLVAVLARQQMQSTQAKKLAEKEVEEVPEQKMVDLMAPTLVQKRASPVTLETVAEKRPKIELEEIEKTPTEEMEATEPQTMLPPLNPLSATLSQIIPTVPSVPAMANSTIFPLPMQYLNPIQSAPMEMSPALLQAMEQQRIMAAFLNHAFRQK